MTLYSIILEENIATHADLNGALNIGKRVIMLITSLRDENDGLGMWLTPRDWAILKARRKGFSSDGKSAPPLGTPALTGKSVADCSDQTSLLGYVSSEDPAMANAVGTPSASGRTGEAGSMQRTETGSHRRDDIPMMRGKARDTVRGFGPSGAGDSHHEKGGTQKFLAVHSHCKK